MSIAGLDTAMAYGRSLGQNLLKPVAASSADALEGAGPAGGIVPPAPIGLTGPSGFGSMLGSMIGDAAGAVKGAETASAKQLAGTGDLIDTATAIGAAEHALETVVAVRDKVVSAYQDIMRMQV